MAASLWLDWLFALPSAVPKPRRLFAIETFAQKATGEVREADLSGEGQVGVFKSWDQLLTPQGRKLVRELRLVMPPGGCQPRMAEELGLLVGTLPALQTLSIHSPHLPAPDFAAGTVELLKNNQGGKPSLVFDFVLDAQADAFAALELESNSLKAVLHVSRELKGKGMKVRWLVPLLPELVYRLEAIFSLACENGVDPVLLPSQFLGGAASPLSPDDRLFVWDFISYRLLEEERHLLPGARLDYYLGLQGHFGEAGLPLPNAEQKVAVLDCAVKDAQTRWALHVEDWPRLGIQGEGKGADPVDEASLSEVGTVLAEGLRGAINWGATCAVSPFVSRPIKEGEKLSRVLAIGAYGGEHIGDAAIFGGVLNRVHQRYGTTEAILMSQRPYHTRHLIPMLDVPVEVEVEEYLHDRIRACLAKVDAVVLAGGPMIDLPKQLVRHLYAVSLAQRQGKPFIVEGIGAGPFKRWESQWVARRLVKMAQYLAVRTGHDGQQPLVHDLAPVVGHDPAFDYLSTLQAELTRLPEVDRAWIDELLEGTEGRSLVGINIRPIRHLYTEGAEADKQIEYTRTVEDRFEQRFAEGLRQFDRDSATRPCFVFYPMNAIQFGQSDLRSAYRIKRHLGDAVDFRIWQADASLDGVVELLRRLDIVISMRFHATIFALAQKRRVIGIDYRIGKRDKVGALLSDFDQSINCARIDELTAEWLCQRLSALAEEPAVG